MIIGGHKVKVLILAHSLTHSLKMGSEQNRQQRKLSWQCEENVKNQVLREKITLGCKVSDLSQFLIFSREKCNF